MPIYEFYCPDCHTIFNFLSRKIDTQTIPPCPGCNKENYLTKKMSRFAMISSGKDGNSELDEMPIDEATMEKAVSSLAAEAESMKEDDPKAAAQLMRKFSSMTGLEYTDSIESALSRLESGEDPERVEEEMGDSMDDNFNPFKQMTKKGGIRKMLPPKKDETLHEM